MGDAQSAAGLERSFYVLVDWTSHIAPIAVR
jgi:hypothetical protein